MPSSSRCSLNESFRGLAVFTTASFAIIAEDGSICISGYPEMAGELNALATVESL